MSLILNSNAVLIKLMLHGDFKRGMMACLGFSLTQAEGGVAEGD